ncbi:unnamed protein product [Acanthoscelides obtectus]|uniref:Uncharacterized protein n=2 Tax=Acanthoscelides obtectus TaxID=200917 RepID=A0A9P0PMH9_ACAOB|nr:unnamed protein product [Acanthoscelides obtectus]CAK1672474.1 hypothetical protein AOBTE_LOCUS28920 [Acanthoscelides obtectus]
MKKNYLFFQFIKASRHVDFGQPAYFCMEQKNFVITIEILTKSSKILIAESKVWRNFCGNVLEAKACR